MINFPSSYPYNYPPATPSQLLSSQTQTSGNENILPYLMSHVLDFRVLGCGNTAGSNGQSQGIPSEGCIDGCVSYADFLHSAYEKLNFEELCQVLECLSIDIFWILESDESFNQFHGMLKKAFEEPKNLKDGLVCSGPLIQAMNALVEQLAIGVEKKEEIDKIREGLKKLNVELEDFSKQQVLEGCFTRIGEASQYPISLEGIAIRAYPVINFRNCVLVFLLIAAIVYHPKVSDKFFLIFLKTPLHFIFSGFIKDYNSPQIGVAR